MEAKSKQRNIKMPARKIRRIINEVRGKKVIDAIRILKFMPYAAARVVEKNITCAMANAEERYSMSPEGLVVSEIYADEGATYKRFKPRAQGRIYKRMKRTSHLTVKLNVDQKSNNK